MRELRHRIRTLVERLRAGEGAHVLADFGETAELWLTSGWLPMPRPLRAPVGQLGTLLGDLARAYRPPPSDVPPPSEPERRAAAAETNGASEVARAPSVAAPLSRDVAPRGAEASTRAQGTSEPAALVGSEVAEPARRPQRSEARKAKSSAPERTSERRAKADGSGAAREKRPTARRAASAGAKKKGASAQAVKKPKKAASEAAKPAASKAPSARKKASEEPPSKTGPRPTGEGRARVSARRASTAKPSAPTRVEEPPADAPKRQKGNGKARERRPAARRKTGKPT